MVPGHIRASGKGKKKVNITDLRVEVGQGILCNWKARFGLGNHFSKNGIKRQEDRSIYSVIQPNLSDILRLLIKYVL